ncbi:MAG: hypothetical protein A3I66_14460 [Burkholderiales bacterium RIFCSPLOWO2_02_FULL_57_36]|nr:MAG: hypothetical protein A3I66_14460 [Burkholderiales bacterium RIFCSPLOWO2_02_FULL_57_36]
MNITPRHLAAAQFTIIGTFQVAAWWMLLSPVNRAVEQLRFIFAPGYELRQFFAWLALATFITVAIALAYWFKQAAVRPLASILFCASGLLLVLSLWWFDTTFIFSYGLGLFCAAWVRFWPNMAVKRDTPQAARPLP